MVVLRNSRTKYFLLLVGSLAFVVLGVFLILSPKVDPGLDVAGYLAGWASIVFFGGCELN